MKHRWAVREGDVEFLVEWEHGEVTVSVEHLSMGSYGRLHVPSQYTMQSIMELLERAGTQAFPDWRGYVTRRELDVTEIEIQR